MAFAKTYNIPNELCRKTGLGAAWLPVNRIGLFPYLNVNANSLDKPSSYAPTDVQMYELRQEVILFQSMLRKLVNEANGTFLKVQQLLGNNSPDLKTGLLKTSLEYRSIIRACLEDLQDELANANSDYKEELKNYITIFYSVECVWHLCEILFIENIPGNVVLSHLLDWIRFHFPRYERNAAFLLSGDLNGIESNPDYWDTVIGSLLQGRIEIVRALLCLHSASDSIPFKMADQIFKAMPLYTVYGELSVAEFNLKYKHWVVDTLSKLDAKMFISDEKLNFIIRLVVGEEFAWVEAQTHCEAWYEFLAAQLFFTEPTVKSFELGQHAKKCIAKMGVREHMKHLDYVLLAAMESDLLQVIKEIQNMNENGWFACHLTDILYHSGSLNIPNKENEDLMSSKLRESFIVDYGLLLLGHESLWQVGLSYLDHCPNDGLNLIQLLLPRIPLKSESRTHKIIGEARKRNLQHLEQGICKVQSMQCLKRGRLGQALTWALKSQDACLSSYLADKFLREYCQSGKIKNIDLLDNLGTCMLACDRLIFLGKYYEFHKLYQYKNYKEAGSLLISLLASKITPKYFWVTLLSDVLPLLECDDLVFTVKDTYIIMKCLEEQKDQSGLDDKADLIRLATSRNLARALIYEAQMV